MVSYNHDLSEQLVHIVWLALDLSLRMYVIVMAVYFVLREVVKLKHDYWN